MEASVTSPGRAYAVVGETLPMRTAATWPDPPHIGKVYRNCPRLLLPERPLEAMEARPAVLSAERLGALLAELYGLTRLRWKPEPVTEQTPGQPAAAIKLPCDLLRPVPSGGALFPGELYVAIPGDQQLPTGLYHYDALHHALETLREGCYDMLLQAQLAQPTADAPVLTLLLSCCFWKTAYKYGTFSYRLHSLDLGVVLAQALRLSEQLGLRATIHYQFHDAAIDQLVGLTPDSESVYAIVTLHDDATRPVASTVSSEACLAPLPAPIQQAASLAHWPLLAAVHHAARHVSRPTVPLAPLTVPIEARYIPLPAPVDLPACTTRAQVRRSALRFFTPGTITLQQLSTALAASARGYHNDLHASVSALGHTLLYCVVNSVAELMHGCYVYDPARHALAQLQIADLRPALQAALREPSYNMWHVSAVIFPVGRYESGFAAYGDRWYRLQNMEAGIVVQRLYQTAAGLGMACHTNLAYYVRAADSLLQLPPDWTSLAEIMIGTSSGRGEWYEQAL